MTDVIEHRGPDDEGYFVNDKGIGLGMRRLSIIDLSGGKQPIESETGQVVVVFNGEIYNYPSLRSELGKQGHIFRTKSDTEVIVHLYEQFGLDFTKHLRGMFAIALYDCTENRLILARDRIGKKPLYYAHVAQTLIFGSEIKSILIAAPELRKTDEKMLYTFLRFGFIPEPQTIYPEIYQLPAGSLLVFNGKTKEISRYWDIDFQNEQAQRANYSTKDYEAELDSLLEEAVKIRLLSDVPLGAFLSGGPDSSLIVAYMSRLLNKPVKTFTISFEEKEFDESDDAWRVSQFCHTDHHVRILKLSEIRKEFFSTIDKIVHHTDQPFGDSSALPTYYVSQLAGQELKVILGGDGADEVFGGYKHYQAFKFSKSYQLIPKQIRTGLLAFLIEQWVAQQPAGHKRIHAQLWQKRIADSNLPLQEMLSNKYSVTSTLMLGKLMPKTAALFRAEERSCVNQIPFGNARTPFEQMQYADLMFHQLNDMLVKVDRMSMANSLETRHPYLDHKVVEFAFALPTELKLRGYETKAILRDLASKYIPIQNARKKKQGFVVPIKLWLQKELWQESYERILTSNFIQSSMDIATVKSVLTQHKEGTADFHNLIWCLLVIASWDAMYL